MPSPQRDRLKLSPCPKLDARLHIKAAVSDVIPKERIVALVESEIAKMWLVPWLDPAFEKQPQCL